MVTTVCPVCGRSFEWTLFAGEAVESVSSTSSVVAPVDIEKLILADAAAGAITLTMPDPVTCEGKRIGIKKVDASSNAITIMPRASEKFVDDVDYDSIALENPGDQAAMTSDGTNWFVTTRL